jgi:hypothetical protein
MTDHSNKKSQIDPINGLIYESESYNSFDQIERLVDDKYDLSNLPIQPIYLALKALPVEKVAELLPRFSKEQREIFLDIDLWQKDEIDFGHFPFWPVVYNLVTDDQVKKDFVTSEQFLLFIKSKFNIWTFDAEEPEYPDHDNYFLTDDGMLLFEFDEDYPYVSEVRELVKHLYYEFGVEYAYTFLFKMVSDSFLILQEEEYQKRKERMRDVGFVDYLDALEMENPFINIDFLNLYLQKKTEHKVELGPISKSQNIHNSALVAFKDKFKNVIDELLQIEDQSRLDYLQFNFIRLINGRLETTSALKNGSVAMSKTGAHTKSVIQLGFNYLHSIEGKKFVGNIGEKGIFAKFDFGELYKIGNSLIVFNKKQLKKSLQVNGFETDEKENFLGEYWVDFLDQSFLQLPKFKSLIVEKAIAVTEYEHFVEWKKETQTLIELLPFAKKFHDTFINLKNEGTLQDSYYLNYKVEEITFDALLLTSFANFYLGVANNSESAAKLGLMLNEFKSFAKIIVNEEGNLNLTDDLKIKIQKFNEHFGLNLISNIDNYLTSILKSSMEGYDFNELSDADYLHVGGPIILALATH